MFLLVFSEVNSQKFLYSLAKIIEKEKKRKHTTKYFCTKDKKMKNVECRMKSEVSTTQKFLPLIITTHGRMCAPLCLTNLIYIL